MAASAPQIAANRENAKKSTGPKAPEGKARSSRNAVARGLLGRLNTLSEDFVNPPLNQTQVRNENPNHALKRLSLTD